MGRCSPFRCWWTAAKVDRDVTGREGTPVGRAIPPGTSTIPPVQRVTQTPEPQQLAGSAGSRPKYAGSAGRATTS